MNRLLLVILFSIFFINGVFSQQAFTFDLFTAQLQDSVLNVRDNGGKLIFQMTFNHPHDYTIDLDGDSIDEYIVIDSTGTPDLPSYYIYIFSTIDEFALADSLASGVTEPYDMFSNEEGGEIIVTGNKEFEAFDVDDSDIFLPINCWKYDSGQIYLINDDIYDLFIQENDEILDYLDSFHESADYDCDAGMKLKSAIAAGYANYLNAGEVTLASQFLKKYYPCADVNKFLKDINQILNQGDSDENGME
jgi:hypothetical protein